MNPKLIIAALLPLWTLVLAGGCGGRSEADSVSDDVAARGAVEVGVANGGASEDVSGSVNEGVHGAAVELWRISEGLAQPESAYYDETTDSIFISNVNGHPIEKDGNGYITKITTDGKVVEAKWATGLNAPKGLRAHGNLLWVADINQIVAIDIEIGKVTERVPIEGSLFLNDLAIAVDGTIYVADTLTNKIHRYHNGQVSVFAEGEELESPNGLLVDGDRLIVAAWGVEPAADFTTKSPGHLYWLDRKSGERHLITKEPLGNLDGVELDGEGGYLVTDLMKGRVLHVDTEGHATELITLGSMGVADHTYLSVQRLLVLPHISEGYVLGLRLRQ